MQNILDIIHELHAQIFAPERIPVAIAALALVSAAGLLTGPLGGFAGPLYARLIDGMFGRIGSKLDKPGRPAADLAFRGFFLTVVILALSFVAGRGAMVASAMYPLYNMLDIFFLSLVMASGTIWAADLRLFKAMTTENTVKGAFFAIARTTRTDLTLADEFTITRTGMGMAARGFDKGVCAPILWFLIGGLPAAFLYAGLSAAAWRFGKDGFTGGFGRIALELEKLMGFVPNLMAGVFIALAGVFTPTGRMSAALTGFLSQKGQAPYFQGGWPVTAMAFALGVSLGGATQDMDASAIKRVWAGPMGATAQLGAKHLYRALYIVILAHILLVLALLGAVVVSGHHLLDFMG